MEEIKSEKNEIQRKSEHKIAFPAKWQKNKNKTKQNKTKTKNKTKQNKNKNKNKNKIKNKNKNKNNNNNNKTYKFVAFNCFIALRLYVRGTWQGKFPQIYLFCLFWINCGLVQCCPPPKAH